MRIENVRQSLARLDIERHTTGARSKDSPRVETVLHNSAHAVLAGANAIPGLSFYSGIVSMVAGVNQVVSSLFDEPTEKRRAALAGAKLAGLGALATFVPVVGNVINGAFAVMDTVDALNAKTLKAL